MRDKVEDAAYHRERYRENEAIREKRKQSALDYYHRKKAVKKEKIIFQQAYFGGRNEIFVKPGTQLSNLYYDDFTSLYPSESRLKLPGLV